MSYFKKFTDLIGGIGAAFAAIFVIGRYMEYDASKLEEGASKLKTFFSSDGPKEYRQYLVFIALLVLTVFAGRVFKRYSAIPLVVSVLPMCQAMGMLITDRFYEREEFYMLVCAALVCGNVYDAAFLDKADGKKRLFVATEVLGFLSAAIAFAGIKLNSVAQAFTKVFFESELTEEQLALVEKLELFGIDVLSVAEKEKETLIFVAVALLVGVIISLALRGVYFVDIILAAVPFVYTLFALHAESFSTATPFIVIPVFVYFVCRAALFVTGAGLKEDKK